MIESASSLSAMIDDLEVDLKDLVKNQQTRLLTIAKLESTFDSVKSRQVRSAEIKSVGTLIPLYIRNKPVKPRLSSNAGCSAASITGPKSLIPTHRWTSIPKMLPQVVKVDTVDNYIHSLYRYALENPLETTRMNLFPVKLKKNTVKNEMVEQILSSIFPPNLRNSFHQSQYSKRVSFNENVEYFSFFEESTASAACAQLQNLKNSLVQSDTLHLFTFDLTALNENLNFNSLNLRKAENVTILTSHFNSSTIYYWISFTILSTFYFSINELHD